MTRKLLTLSIVSMLILTACDKKESTMTSSKDGKLLAIIYDDYKCSYYKESNEKIIPKFCKNYTDNHKVEYQSINLVFLSKDSVIGSHTNHVVLMYVPKSFLDFQKQLSTAQQDENEEWLTKELLDKRIKRLYLDKETENKTIKDYKTRDSKPWRTAEKDRRIAKDNHVKTIPIAFINGGKVEDPYDYESYEKLLKDKIK